jgi:hypothetical protein
LPIWPTPITPTRALFGVMSSSFVDGDNWRLEIGY